MSGINEGVEGLLSITVWALLGILSPFWLLGSDSESPALSVVSSLIFSRIMPVLEL